MTNYSTSTVTAQLLLLHTTCDIELMINTDAHTLCYLILLVMFIVSHALRHTQKNKTEESACYVMLCRVEMCYVLHLDDVQ